PPAQKPPPPKNEEFLKTYIEEEAEEAEPVRKKSFLRRAGVLLLFLAVFAGALFVTQSYLRTGRIFPEIKNPFVSQQGIAINDVNLRTEANADSQKIGLVPKSSRVRIVNSKDNWYEVDVLEYGRPKENAADADHGWVNRRYIDIQE
ncbi:MAG TPA: SH3 domain-containing protein, partial [Pyrinomonadaceae bacterium]